MGLARHADPHRAHPWTSSLLVLHGGGGHSGALWPLAALAAIIGYEVLAPDLPGYGLTKVPDPGAVTYPDWVDCVADLLRPQSATGALPLVLLGGSMGGLLGYSASARVPDAVAHLPARPFQPDLLARGHGRALARLRLPIRWIAPMHAIANQPALARLCLLDERGGGSRVPVGFLASFLYSTPEVAPEQFRQIPVTLVHPTEDRWTPPSMSLALLQLIAAPVRHVPLEGCGHFPVEDPDLSMLIHVFEETLAKVAGPARGEGHAAG